jgi:hypothetical protein
MHVGVGAPLGARWMHEGVARTRACVVVWWIVGEECVHFHPGFCRPLQPGFVIDTLFPDVATQPPPGFILVHVRVCHHFSSQLRPQLVL